MRIIINHVQPELCKHLCDTLALNFKDAILGGSTVTSDVNGFTNAAMARMQKAAMPRTVTAAITLGIVSLRLSFIGVF